MPPNLQSYLRFNPSLPFHLNVDCVALSRMWTSTVENWQTAGASASKADVAAPLSLFNWLYLSAQHKYDLTLRERMKNRQNSLRFRLWSWRCGDFVSQIDFICFLPDICSLSAQVWCLLAHLKYVCCLITNISSAATVRKTDKQGGVWRFLCFPSFDFKFAVLCSQYLLNQFEKQTNRGRFS